MRIELLKALVKGWKLVEQEEKLNGNKTWREFFRKFQSRLSITPKEQEKMNDIYLSER